MFTSKSSLNFVLYAALASSLVLISGCTTNAPRHETSVAQYINSTSITLKVKENLIRDPDINNSTKIAVNTYKDTVTLSGAIKDQFQENKAIEIARNVRGVKYVVDNMKLRQA